MKIIYILKKGFHCYPPCLAQVLYLNELNIDIEVYHGRDSDAINEILNKRKIVHHHLNSDRDNYTTLQSAVTMLAYKKEVKKIIKSLPANALIWYGNCESAMGVGSLILSHKYVLSVLELYDRGSIYDKFLKKYIVKAQLVTCCEKHRAAIMKVYYHLKKDPYIMPNKPYELGENLNENDLPNDIKNKISIIKDKFVVLYQGIITPDRPLDKIAEALATLNDDNIVFVVMGKASDTMKQIILNYYNHVIFINYVPSPQHLLITKYANIGIANYDYSSLNNLYCAPNKIYEYAKFAVPMLTSDNLGLTETIGRFGAAECVDFNNVESIKIGMKKIVESNDVYSKNAVSFYNNTNNKVVMSTIVKELERNSI